MARRVNRVWYVVVIVAILAGGVGLPAARAQDPVDRARYNVEQWIKQQLGKPSLILVEYTYAGTSWPDSSLGCPVENETYTQEVVNGYRWTFLFDNMVRYEVHSNLDGTEAVLCYSVSTSPDVSLSTYTTTTFTVLTPDSWLVFPNDDQTDVLFAPQEAMACDQPGMRVTVLGRVASGVTPDQLLDEHLAEVGVSDSPSDRTTVGSFGRSTLYQTDCKSGTRQWRVSTFVQYGSAYKVEQWAATDNFEQWAKLYLDMLSQFGPSDSIIPGSATAAATESPDENGGTPVASVSAADLPPLPMAHLFVGDLFVGALNHIPGRSVTNVPTVDRRFLEFSPDGLWLSFIDVTNGQLRVLDAANGLSPRKVADNIDPRFPPAWKPDSQSIAYVAPTDETDANGDPLVAIMAVPPAGGDTQQLGTFAFGGDCDTPITDPADVPYFDEIGSMGQENTLVWMPGDEFLISTACDGGIGLLTLADNQMTVLGTDLHGGVISPDWSEFLARTDTGLAILDLNQWQRLDLVGGQGAQQLAWGPADRTVYYSTATLSDSVTLDDSADQERGESVFGVWPVTIGVYDLSLMSINLDTGAEATLWQGQGRGIGRIDPAPDSSGILFSVVQSSLPLAEVFQAGADPLAVREAWPDVALYWQFADDTSAYLLAYSSQPTLAPITVDGE